MSGDRYVDELASDQARMLSGVCDGEPEPDVRLPHLDRYYKRALTRSIEAATGKEAMGTEIQKTNSGAALQQAGFGEASLTPYAETQARAVAARESAAVQARYIVAMQPQNRRNLQQFRKDLEVECRQPGFAAVARYAKPLAGTKIEGPSIRFVEAALRHFRNVFTEVSTVFDDDKMRICRVVVADLEANDGYATEVQVVKTVERRGYEDRRTGKVEPPRGREVLGSRTNSQGEPVFICVATDDEVITKQNALISKAIRTQGLRILPGGIVDEMQQLIVGVMSKQVVDDPTAALNALVDSFARLGVQPVDIQAWAEGRPLDRLTPKDIVELRGIYAAIRDGEATWGEVMEGKNPTGTAEAAAAVVERKLLDLKKDKPAVDTSPMRIAKTAFADKQETHAPPSKYLTAKQIGEVHEALANSDLPEAEFLAGLKQMFGVDRVEMVPADKFGDVMAWMQSPIEDEPAPLSEEEMARQTAAADAQHGKDAQPRRGGRLKL